MKKRYRRICIRIILVCFLIGTIVTKARDMLDTKAVFGNGGDRNISRDLTGGIPRFYQWDKRWGEKSYGGNKMKKNGCGPTCLSMVWCGLTGKTKWNPYEVAKMAEKKGFYVPGVGSSWELMTEGAKEMGMHGEVLSFDEDQIRRVLKNGQPVICAMGPGDFTTEGHFIVLTGITDEGKILLNDPNSKENSEKDWELEQIMGQMRNLWVYSM